MEVSESISALDRVLRRGGGSGEEEEVLLKALAVQLCSREEGGEDGCSAKRLMATRAISQLVTGVDSSLVPVLRLLDGLGCPADHAMRHVETSLTVSAFKAGCCAQSESESPPWQAVPPDVAADIMPMLAFQRERDYPAVFECLFAWQMSHPTTFPHVSWRCPSGTRGTSGNDQDHGRDEQATKRRKTGVPAASASADMKASDSSSNLILGIRSDATSPPQAGLVLHQALQGSPSLHCSAWQTALPWVVRMSFGAATLAPMLRLLVKEYLLHAHTQSTFVQPWPTHTPFTHAATLALPLRLQNLHCVLGAARSALAHCFARQKTGSLADYVRLKRPHMVLLFCSAGFLMHSTTLLAVAPFMRGGEEETTAPTSGGRRDRDALLVLRRALHDGGMDVDGMEGHSGDDEVDAACCASLVCLLRSAFAAMDAGGGSAEDLWEVHWGPLWLEMESTESTVLFLRLCLAKVVLSRDDQPVQLAALCRLLLATLQAGTDQVANMTLCRLLVAALLDLARHASHDAAFLVLAEELCPGAGGGKAAAALPLTLDAAMADATSPVGTLFHRVGALSLS